jgi:hypothetical protein
MILIDGEKFDIPEDNRAKLGKWSKKELKEALPEVFKGGRKIGFKFDESLFRIGTDPRTRRQIKQGPERRMIPRKSKVLHPVTEVLVTVEVTDKYESKDGRLVAKDRKFEITKGRTIGSDELEMLWFLWFVSNDIKNNANPITSGNARLSFYRPDQEAMTENERDLFVSRLKSKILDSEELPEAELRELAYKCLISGADNIQESVLRRDMANRLTHDKKFSEEVNQHLHDQDSHLSQIKALCTKLVDKKIVVLENNNWVIPGEGEQESQHITGVGKDETPIVRLGRTLAGDEELKAELEARLEQS